MKKTMVYDLPTRLFHFSFAAVFLTAFAIAKIIDDESPIYSYHMMLGLLLSSLVIWRIVWGVIGSRYARFSSFKLHPKDLIDYFKGFVSGGSKRDAGHNPASSWAAIVMFILTLGLGFTGYMMASGNDKEFYEEIHELLANGFIVIVAFHVVGVILHTIRHRDAIALSMVSGGKQDFSSDMGITKSHKLAALIFVLFVAGVVFQLNKNYDASKQTLNFFGTSLQLGEGEETEGQSQGEERSEDDDDE